MKSIKSSIVESWNLFQSNWKSIPLFVLFDIVFFLGFALVYSIMWNLVHQTLYTISTLMENANLNVDYIVEAQGMQSFMNFQQNFNYHFRKLVLYFSLAIIMLYILWVITQGINWFLSSRIVQKKKRRIKSVRFVLNFALVTLIWGIIAFAIIRWGVSLANDSLYTLVPSVAMTLSTYATGFVLLIILYFTFVSYSLTQYYQGKELVKKSFTEPLKQFKAMAPSFILSVILVAVLNYALIRLVPYGIPATTLFFLIIMLPSFAFVRIYMSKAVSS